MTNFPWKRVLKREKTKKKKKNGRANEYDACKRKKKYSGEGEIGEREGERESKRWARFMFLYSELDKKNPGRKIQE